MDDQDHLDQVGTNDHPSVGRLTGDHPSRIVEVNGVPDDERDVVQEYEDRYYGRRLVESADESAGGSGGTDDSGGWRAPTWSQVPGKTKRKNEPDVSDNERKWAALAHGSTLLTALVSILTAGAGTLVTIFVPLLIYLSFRKRSEYVAFQALQAFTAQLIGTIGWMALLITSIIAAVILTVVLAITLVGIPLIAVVWLGAILLIVASLLIPLGMIVYSVIALVEVRSGHNYRMPKVGRWVESQMYDNAFIEF
ncbi:MAG: DUF4870 domain-containing protein [Anaerolineae bacterium]|nr:DUF4870 domain-containing protein [Anaerolineae bacterium]